MSLRIEDYAVIGDLHTAALVGLDGSIDWLCLPRFDSPACFAALLDTPEAGRWLLAPADGSLATERAYRDDTLVLQQTWRTPTGEVRVTDFMPPRGAAPDIVRIVEGLRGRVSMRTQLRIRFDYGKVAPWIRRDDGRWSAVAGPDAVWLDAPKAVDDEQMEAGTCFDIEAGQRLSFVLTWAPSFRDPPARVDADRALTDSLDTWSGWLTSCTYEGAYADAVRRSLLVLKALTYAPTGGVAAAVTTSLPEQIGGSRNWDYRYCWLRDAAFTLQALAGAGFTSEASAWRSWLLRAVAGDPADLQIMYSLTGRRRLEEYELPWLDGYEQSRPVRVGNAAVGQFQLDVWGEVLDGLHEAREAGLAPDEDAWDLQVALTGYLATVWQNPDHSLWEMRGPPRHFVHSKVMAWVGFDRMIRTAERSGLPGPVDRWRAARDAVHAEVCARGFDADRGTFTQFYGSRGLDAALLLLPRLGFLPPDDPRIEGTVRAVQRELCADGFVLRYRPDAEDPGGAGSVDGLSGSEGAFLACSFWLVDALTLTGRRDEATALFARLLSLRNDVGLLSEEWDSQHQRQVGNTPQALSHVALVNTALALGATQKHLFTDGHPTATGDD